jgi:hypothetical protein
MEFPELEIFALTKHREGGQRGAAGIAWATITIWVGDGCRFYRFFNANHDEGHVFLVCMLY